MDSAFDLVYLVINIRSKIVQSTNCGSGTGSVSVTDGATLESSGYLQCGDLNMSGQQSLEVGGKDFGADAEGFTFNFFSPQYLALAGSGTYVSLVDNINNTPGPDGEALYVGGPGQKNTTLNVPSGTTLNLNGIKLYVYLDNAIHRVRAGEGALFGGGQIIDRAVTPTLNRLLLD